MSGRRRRRRDLAPGRGEAARQSRTAEDWPLSYLAAVRVAHRDAPSLRELARRIGVSAAALSLFELGRYELPPAKLAALAEQLERPAEELRWRWARQALAFHSAMVVSLRLRVASMRRPPGRRGARPRAQLKRAVRPAIDRLKRGP